MGETIKRSVGFAGLLMNPMGLFLVAGGLFSAFCAAGDFDWFMNNSRARLFTAALGRNGARVFYILLGVALIVIGSLITAGIIADKS